MVTAWARRGLARAGLALGLAASLVACGSCPPQWVAAPPQQRGWLHASGSAGDVFVDADPVGLALTRAARRLGDELGLDLERRLAVSLADGRLWVDAEGPQGPVEALDALQLVDLVRCDGQTYVLVRLPEPGPPPRESEVDGASSR